MNRKKTPEINFDAWLTGTPEPPTPPAEPAPATTRERKATAARQVERKPESKKPRKSDAAAPKAASVDDAEESRKVEKGESKKTVIQESTQTGILTDIDAELNAAAVRVNSGLLESKNSDEIMARIVALVAAHEQGGGSEKVKASYHVNRATVTTLDAIQFGLKNLTGLTGHDISKSKILDIMMALTAADLAEQGSGSRLARLLVETAGTGGGSDE